MKKIITKSLILLALLPLFARADVIFDAPPDENDTGFVDQEFPDFDEYSTYLVDDVILAADYVITSVTTYFTSGFGGWPTGDDAFSAVLNIFDGDALDNTDDPSSGGDNGLASVMVDVILNGNTLSVTANGLSIALDSGMYWFGLTPILDAGPFGQEFHMGVGAGNGTGSAAYARNPGGAFGFGSEWLDAGETFAEIKGWNMALRVEGDLAAVPEPGTLALLGLGLAGIGFARRKKGQA